MPHRERGTGSMQPPVRGSRRPVVIERGVSRYQRAPAVADGIRNDGLNRGDTTLDDGVMSTQGTPLGETVPVEAEPMSVVKGRVGRVALVWATVALVSSAAFAMASTWGWMVG